jgi:uncharacterized protein
MRPVWTTQWTCPNVAVDVLEMMTRGDIANSSFAFQVYDQEWGFADGLPLRKLLSGKLIDVAAVVTPAYVNKSVALRSLAEAKDVPYEDVAAHAERGELCRFFTRSDRSSRLSPRQRQVQIMARRCAMPTEPSTPMSGRQALLATRAKRCWPQ